MRATEMKSASGRESGFSLIELMIAMVVTLIVTGAIFGLLSGGNSAFRREPQLADRQQNTRVAMSMIETDIGNAGTGLPPFVQVFAAGLDGQGPNGEDALEIIVGLPQCPLTPVCARGADSGAFQVFETPDRPPRLLRSGPASRGAVAPGTPPSRLGAALSSRHRGLDHRAHRTGHERRSGHHLRGRQHRGHQRVRPERLGPGLVATLPRSAPGRAGRARRG